MLKQTDLIIQVILRLVLLVCAFNFVVHYYRGIETDNSLIKLILLWILIELMDTKRKIK